MNIQPNVPNMPNLPPAPQQIPMLAPQGQIPQTQAEKMDNISKVKSLLLPLRESLSLTLKAAAQVVYNDSVGNMKNPERFDKHLEEFYSICDQMELNLKTAKTCIQQSQSSHKYLPHTVVPTKLEPNLQDNTLAYPQYLDLVRMQISYAKEINDTLIMAAQNICQMPD